MGTGQPTYPVNLADTDKVVSTSAGAADAGKLIKTNASGLLESTFLPEITPIRSYIAGENITADDAVTAGFYQADGGILYDTSVKQNGATTVGGVDKAITIAANNNRVLIAVVTIGTGASLTNVNYNGQAMTLVTTEGFSTASGSLQTYVLFNPPTGFAYNFHFDSEGAIPYALTLHSYYNVTQAVHLSADMHPTGGAVAMTLTSTPTLNGTMIFSAMARHDSAGTLSVGPVNMANNRQDNTTNMSLYVGDSGIVYPKVATTVSATGNIGEWNMASLVFSPITVPTFGAVLKTDGSALANAANLDKANNFIGFATENKNAGETIKVQTDGIYTSLTGLNPFQTYYVSDTNGAIATSAGTISKKVGKAISATDLLIQHDNT